MPAAQFLRCCFHLPRSHRDVRLNSQHRTPGYGPNRRPGVLVPVPAAAEAFHGVGVDYLARLRWIVGAGGVAQGDEAVAGACDAKCQRRRHQVQVVGAYGHAVADGNGVVGVDKGVDPRQAVAALEGLQTGAPPNCGSWSSFHRKLCTPRASISAQAGCPAPAGRVPAVASAAVSVIQPSSAGGTAAGISMPSTTTSATRKAGNRSRSSTMDKLQAAATARLRPLEAGESRALGPARPMSGRYAPPGRSGARGGRPRSSHPRRPAARRTRPPRCRPPRLRTQPRRPRLTAFSIVQARNQTPWTWP